MVEIRDLLHMVPQRPNARTTVEGPTLERSAEKIRHDIDAKRESVSKTIDRLRERFHEAFDWRGYIVHHPYAALGIAAGLGFLIAGVFRPHLTSHERIVEALAESAEGLADRFRDTANLPLEKKSGVVPAVKATVAKAATKAALEFFSRNGVRGSS